MRLGRKPTPKEERFWSRVQKTDECWIWTGRVCPNGYGKFSFGSQYEQNTIYAHRWVLELKLGRRLRKGEVSRHLCRNRRCVNPDHLEPGTQSENIKESWETRRNARNRPAYSSGPPPYWGA